MEDSIAHMSAWGAIGWLLLAYLIGVFPTGKLVAALYGVQLERVGSGNVGATNVSRVLGKGPGIVTLLGDVAKGALAVSLATTFVSPEMAAAAAVAVVSGHCFSIPRLLKGGKGVATSLGALLAISPLLAGAVVVVFAVLLFVGRRVSLASITAAAAAPGLALLLHLSPIRIYSIVLIAVIVVVRHHQNIVRLLRGEEAPFSFGKK